MNRFASRKQEIAGRFSLAAAHYADFAALQQAIADVLLQDFQPQGGVLDAGCGRGRESRLLMQQPDVAKVVALDIAPAMLEGLPASERLQPLLGDMEAVPLPDASVSAVFSNFAMQWAESRGKLAQEMFRVLQPGGELRASVPGPGSLQALRDSGLHINHFASPADWETALRQAGFRDCQFQRRDFTLHFATVRELLQALQGIGAGTSDQPRDNHLLGRRWLQQVSAALEARRQPQGLPLQYDVIFMKALR